MTRYWTTEPFAELSTAIQTAVLNRSQVDSVGINTLETLFDNVFEDLRDLTESPPKNATHRDAISKSGT